MIHKKRRCVHTQPPIGDSSQQLNINMNITTNGKFVCKQFEKKEKLYFHRKSQRSYADPWQCCSRLLRLSQSY